MRSILLVEDEESLAATLGEQLSAEGYSVTRAASKAEAARAFSKSEFDLAILDIGLPDGSGLDLARDMRLSKEIPIVFLTAMNSAEYRLEGYELGASEYIPKPFFIKELLLRIARVLGQSAAVKLVRVFDVEIDLHAMSIKFQDGKISFPGTKDFLLLKTLIEHSPEPVSREQLSSALEPGKSNITRSVDNAIVRLRQALGAQASQCIRSVRGLGYQWAQF